MKKLIGAIVVAGYMAVSAAPSHAFFDILFPTTPVAGNVGVDTPNGAWQRKVFAGPQDSGAGEAECD